jgi:hypothetical protein
MSKAAVRRGPLFANVTLAILAVAAATGCTNHPDQAASGATTKATAAGVGLTPGVLDAGPRARSTPGTTKPPATTSGVSSAPATVLVTTPPTSALTGAGATTASSTTAVPNTVVVATHTVPQSTRPPLTVTAPPTSTTYPTGPASAGPSPSLPPSTAPLYGTPGATSTLPEIDSSASPLVLPRDDRFPTTSCTAVVHIGDSTTVGMNGDGALRDPRLYIDAQYRRVGVQSTLIDALGGRSIHETLRNEPNALTAARKARAEGFRGCWVFALGTNDAANIAKGSDMPAAERITEMMAVAGGDPVMWVSAYTFRTGGDYDTANMLRWNEALLEAAARYPTMKILDWAAIAKKEWFLSDGIHYTGTGYALRARLIANALAAAFPA